jgi:hypothetical protein
LTTGFHKIASRRKANNISDYDPEAVFKIRTTLLQLQTSRFPKQLQNLIYFKHSCNKATLNSKSDTKVSVFKYIHTHKYTYTYTLISVSNNDWMEKRDQEIKETYFESPEAL